ncbi:MAG: hypothetical protein ACRDH9_09410 [Actinomycetota bacterium]
MAVAQTQSTSNEQDVRTAIESALAAQGGTTVENGAGKLVMDLGGSVKAAYLAGGFRNKMKMPMRIVITTAGGAGGTGVSLDVHSRGTAGGAMSGGLLGASKQKKAEEAWLAMAVEAIPSRVGG